MSTDTTADSVEWEAIARREVAENHRQFFEEEVDAHLSAYLRELREPGHVEAEREALFKILHRLSTASELLGDAAEDVGALDEEDADALREGARAMSNAAHAVTDRDLDTN